MTVLYQNQCYKVVCFKGTAMKVYWTQLQALRELESCHYDSDTSFCMGGSRIS